MFLTSFFQAFVENNPAIRWCPAARCERAVRLTRPGPGDSDPQSFPLLPSPAVDCGKGHLFCWYIADDLLFLQSYLILNNHVSVTGEIFFFQFMVSSVFYLPSPQGVPW